MAQADFHISARHTALHLLAAPFVALGNTLVAMGEANTRTRESNFLHSLSDKELAKRGLKREDIALHVFGDQLYV